MILGVIWITASISKILDMSGFVDTVVAYDLIPQTLAEIYGWMVPWVELYLGCSLILGVLPRVSAAISILLTANFAIASTYALEKFPDSTCGCFGSFILLSHTVSLTIDGIMFLMALVILVNRSPEFLTLGERFHRINPNLRAEKKASYYISLIGTVGLLMAIVAAASYGVDSLVSSMKNSTTQQKVTILAPISDKVVTPLEDGKPVLIYVYAEGCSSCEVVKPIIEELAGYYSDSVAYVKVDYYQYTSQLIEMGIVSTPTVWVITSQNTNGTFNLLEKFGGSLEREELKNALDKALRLLR
jgi:uncharacterized membrane protein YphA (DoxX/SURF4 family)